MSVLKVDTIQNTSGEEQETVSVTWAYNHATPAINDSMNVSSITDAATGRYDVSFSITLSGVFYIACGGWTEVVNTLADRTLQARNRATTSCVFYTVANAGPADNETAGMVVD